MVKQTARPTDPEWLSIKDVAGLFGISMTAAYELAERDAFPIPTHRVGRQFRFSRHAYEALMHQQKDEPTPAGSWPRSPSSPRGGKA